MADTLDNVTDAVANVCDLEEVDVIKEGLQELKFFRCDGESFCRCFVRV